MSNVIASLMLLTSLTLVNVGIMRSVRYLSEVTLTSVPQCSRSVGCRVRVSQPQDHVSYLSEGEVVNQSLYLDPLSPVIVRENHALLLNGVSPGKVTDSFWRVGHSFHTSGATLKRRSYQIVTHPLPPREFIN